MREVNFSIPNANKASVGITTALYDRRALDCTSTLPLINSLNNLAYLTTSSGRIRDILTVDGGIERLVCILKEGRSKDPMEMWKWNLAFQCIVNVGVRGSEAVRTRVVEADMVPVIATLLDNYFQVIEKSRENDRRKCPYSGSRGFSRSSGRTESSEHRSSRARRQAPPPISIPEVLDQAEADEQPGTVTPTAITANLSLSSPPERTTFARQHHRSHTSRATEISPGLGSSRPLAPPLTSVPSQNNITADFVRPVRDVDRLPSMVPTFHAEHSLPQSPTTPSGPPPRAGEQHIVTNSPRQRRRPSIRHQLSTSGSDDDGQIEENAMQGSNAADSVREPMVGIQADIVMEDIADDDSILQPQDAAVTINVTDITGADDDAFNIAHNSGADVSIVNPAATPTQDRMIIPAIRLPDATAAAPAPNLQQQLMWSTRTLQTERLLASGVKFIPAALPRDEDVLMSLQLLAYVSKYCNLRTYFQKSHLVPRLKISENDLCQLLENNPSSFESSSPTQEELDDEWDNEFVEKPGQEPYNIFPLIEKFTAKHNPSPRHPQPAAMLPQQGDMQYWAGVVMRNLCRKDDSRGGIRQCAYWKCGKWEEFTRQFAKCRRCRRTKYCSKDCQKGAWGSHRFWCVAADDGASSSSHGHSHGHSRVESVEAGSSSGGDRLQVPAARHHRSSHSHHHHSHH